MYALTTLFDRLDGEDVGIYCTGFLLPNDAACLWKAQAKAQEAAK